jgi:ABC-2 type transport system ATP-binding protein
MFHFPSAQASVLLFSDRTERGKTTIVKLLLDFTRPTAGHLSLNGLSTTNAKSRAFVGYLPENHRIPTHLSGWQYLKRCAALLDIKGADADKQCQWAVTLTGMQGREHDKSGTYSKGMIQRFGLGAALIGRPKTADPG